MSESIASLLYRQNLKKTGVRGKVNLTKGIFGSEKVGDRCQERNYHFDFEVSTVLPDIFIHSLTKFVKNMNGSLQKTSSSSVNSFLYASKTKGRGKKERKIVAKNRAAVLLMNQAGHGHRTNEKRIFRY